MSFISVTFFVFYCVVLAIRFWVGRDSSSAAFRGALIALPEVREKLSLP